MVEESRKVIREGKPNQYKEGKYANVPLTATQYLKLKAEFPNDWEKESKLYRNTLKRPAKNTKIALQLFVFAQG